MQCCDLWRYIICIVKPFDLDLKQYESARLFLWLHFILYKSFCIWVWQWKVWDLEFQEVKSYLADFKTKCWFLPFEEIGIWNLQKLNSSKISFKRMVPISFPILNIHCKKITLVSTENIDFFSNQSPMFSHKHTRNFNCSWIRSPSLDFEICRPGTSLCGVF